MPTIKVSLRNIQFRVFFLSEFYFKTFTQPQCLVQSRRCSLLIK